MTQKLRLAGPVPTLAADTHRRGSMVIGLTAATLAGSIGWASFAHLDQISRASGQVIPTGHVQVVEYLVVDDVGTVVNPAGVKGQIHGGVAQGLGQALMEQVAYDRDSGQLLSGSFMDYAMPRANDMPPMHVESNPVPTKLNPMGAKGAGEAGTVGAIPAVMNAVLDALAPVGVTELDMPATGLRVWNAIRAAKSRAAGAKA